MLAPAAAVRPAAHLAVRASSSCTRCAALRSPALSAPAAGASRPARLYVNRTPSRGAATLAQAGDQIHPEHRPAEQAQDDHPAPHPADLPPLDDHAPDAALTDLIRELAHDPRVHDPLDSAPGPASSSASASASSLPSAAAAPPPPAGPPPAPRLSIQTLLKPSLPAGGPTLDDLRALRPRRFTLPDAHAPESHRLVYRKTWESAVNRIDRAFNKRQLADFAGPDGLHLDLTDPRLRTGTRGKKPRFWKSKRIDQMTKRELIHTILVLEFYMVDPETIPSAKTGPRMAEAVPLDDRTLFLLLSPNSRTIPNLTRQLGIQVAFRRNPDTGAIELTLHGTKASVASAKEELELLEHTCARGEFTLPGPATTLRPEVYQAISRTAKAFLAPGPLPNLLLASAIEPKLIERAERLVNSAFALHTERTATALFASVPTVLDTLKYAMYPFTPASPLPPAHTGGTPHFARIQTLSVRPLGAGDDDPDALAHARTLDELLDWTDQMRMDRTTRQALYVPPGGTAGSTVASSVRDAPSVWKLLKAPFEAAAGGAAGLNGDEAVPEQQPPRVAVRARFGHVAWPLYRSRGGLDPAQDKRELGPAFSGVWPFARVARWAERSVQSVKNVFLPASPSGHLESTRVLTPLPVAPSVSPFAAVLNPALAGAAERESSAQNALIAAEVESGPSLESVVLRRWTYRARGAAPPGGEVPRRVEIEFELDNEGELPSVREMKICRSEVRIVRENKVDVMVPTGSHDAQFSMIQTTVLDPEEYPAELDSRTMTFHASPPVHLTVGGEAYLLDTDHHVRRTVIIPPSASSSSVASATDTETGAPSSSSSSSNAPPSPELVTVQETWHSLTRDGTRGTEVYALLGEGKLSTLQSQGTWRTGLREVERRCRGRRADQRGGH